MNSSAWIQIQEEINKNHRRRWANDEWQRHEKMKLREQYMSKNTDFVHSRDCRSWLCQFIWWLFGKRR